MQLSYAGVQAPAGLRQHAAFKPCRYIVQTERADIEYTHIVSQTTSVIYRPELRSRRRVVIRSEANKTGKNDTTDRCRDIQHVGQRIRLSCRHTQARRYNKSSWRPEWAARHHYSDYWYCWQGSTKEGTQGPQNRKYALIQHL